MNCGKKSNLLSVAICGKHKYLQRTYQNSLKKNDSTTLLIEGPKYGIRGTVVIPFRLKLPSGNQSEGTKMEANSRKNKCFREERIV